MAKRTPIVDVLGEIRTAIRKLKRIEKHLTQQEKHARRQQRRTYEEFMKSAIKTEGPHEPPVT